MLQVISDLVIAIELAYEISCERKYSISSKYIAYLNYVSFIWHCIARLFETLFVTLYFLSNIFIILLTVILITFQLRFFYNISPFSTNILYTLLLYYFFVLLHVLSHASIKVSQLSKLQWIPSITCIDSSYSQSFQIVLAYSKISNLFK